MADVEGFSIAVDSEDRAVHPTIRALSGIVTLFVPEEAQFKHPVRLRWEYPECGEETTVRMNVGKSARLMLIEELVTVAGTRNTKTAFQWTHTMEIILSESAQVEFVSAQTASASVQLTLKQRSHLSDNAKIMWRNITLGAHTVDHDLLSELHGSDAVSEIDWVFYAKDEEKYRLHARNIFNGRRGGGEITMKGVAEEKGHVQCDGMIEIGNGGTGTDTYLTQDVLMLDKTAKVDAIPGLEIKTNDVRASHSATVSRVTDENLFYFAARGIIEKEARRMFVEGFLGEMVERIGDRAVREETLASVKGKYGT